MSKNQILILQLQANHSVRHQLHNHGHHSTSFGRLHGRVRTHGPFSVTATQCSKCAETEPSLVTAVHLSDKTRISGPPAFTIGSIASTMPSFSRGFSFLRST